MSNRGPQHNRKGAFYWSPEQDARLISLWNDPANTGNKLAGMFGISKGAIYGRATRLHLEPKRNINPRAAAVKAPAAKAPKVQPNPAPAIVVPDALPAFPASAPRISLMESIAVALARSTKACQFPISASAPFMFCDAPARDGYPYCQDHCEVAYVAFVARRGNGKLEGVAA